MKNTQTLFSHYKEMINNMWAKGQREYTAKELNSHVGFHEKNTWWKRINNNPYYSTRTYQSALKNLGCITPIKHGLWKINGPIPEWFGSFHINALTSKWALQDLEKSSFYWKSLPKNHKVNPWKNIDPMHVMSSTGCVDTDCDCSCNPQTDLVQYTIEKQFNITATHATAKYLVFVSPSNKPSDPATDIVDVRYFIGSTKTEVSFDEAKGFFRILGHEQAFLEACKKMETDVVKQACDNFIKDTQAKTETGISQEQLKKLLIKFGEIMKNEVMDVVTCELGRLDESDIVSLSFDEFSRQIEVEVDDRTIISVVEDAVEGSNGLEDVVDAFILKECMFKK